MEVSDTGLGIAPEDLTDARLFSPYVQTDIGRSQGGKGTGLGLAIVRSIVNLSKGRLGVITRKGHGSIFWMELPMGTGLVSHLSDSFRPRGTMSQNPTQVRMMKSLSSPFDFSVRPDQAMDDPRHPMGYVNPTQKKHLRRTLTDVNARIEVSDLVGIGDLTWVAEDS